VGIIVLVLANPEVGFGNHVEEDTVLDGKSSTNKVGKKSVEARPMEEDVENRLSTEIDSEIGETDRNSDYVVLDELDEEGEYGHDYQFAIMHLPRYS
jgi:hypothetical protein